MRYSAATCDPNNFVEEGHTLRQVLYDPPRRTELFIVLTIYNEDEGLFCRTINGSRTCVGGTGRRRGARKAGQRWWCVS
jgi:chitin synthase